MCVWVVPCQAHTSCCWRQASKHPARNLLPHGEVNFYRPIFHSLVVWFSGMFFSQEGLLLLRWSYWIQRLCLWKADAEIAWSTSRPRTPSPLAAFHFSETWIWTSCFLLGSHVSGFEAGTSLSSTTHLPSGKNAPSLPDWLVSVLLSQVQNPLEHSISLSAETDPTLTLNITNQSFKISHWFGVVLNASKA